MSTSERENFFRKVIPKMVKLCIDLPELVTAPLPLLIRYMNHSISLTQKQIASLLANAFFSTFPERLEKNDQFPSINFNELVTSDYSEYLLHIR
jgi:poly(ADP-ribose) glycohydrolase